jgi:hypothetical protein
VILMHQDGQLHGAIETLETGEGDVLAAFEGDFKLEVNCKVEVAILRSYFNSPFEIKVKQQPEE